MAPSPSSILRVPPPRLGARGIFVAAVALVVSASTLVGDYSGFAYYGAGYVWALAAGASTVALAAASACTLALKSPFAGGIYGFIRAARPGRRGRWIGAFFSLLFLGTFLFGASAETRAAAHALSVLVPGSVPFPATLLAVACAVLLPNGWGLRVATRVTAVLVGLMLAVRWGFGVAGWFGWARTGPWVWEHLAQPAPTWASVPAGGVASAFALGFWAFVGLENVCVQAGDTERPRRALPLGLGVALVVIFVTNIVSGLGTIGGLPRAEWLALMAGPSGCGGEAPHLAVGEAMAGLAGRRWMAVATLASSLSTLIVAFAAMAKLLQSLAAGRHLPARAGRWLAQAEAATGAPRRALCVLGLAYGGVMAAGGALGACLQLAAYLWFVRHAVLHALAWLVRHRAGVWRPLWSERAGVWIAGVGTVLTLALWRWSFAGAHLGVGSRAAALGLCVGLLLVGARLPAWRRRRRAARGQGRPRPGVAGKSRLDAPELVRNPS